MDKKLALLPIIGLCLISLVGNISIAHAQEEDLYPVAGHKNVVYDDKIWVIGGSEDVDDSSLYYNKVAYSKRGYNWTVEDNIPFSDRMYPGVAVYNDKLWVLGGGVQNNGSLTSVYNDIWTMNENYEWSEQNSGAPWTARYGMGAIVFDNKLWVMGGNDGSQDRGDVWSYDGNSWTQVTTNAGWENRRLFGAVRFRGKMWVFCGGDPSDAYLDAWYSDDGANWVNSISDVDGQGKLGSVYLQHKDRIWVIAGSEEATGGPSDKVEFTWGDENYSYYTDYHHAEFEPRIWADGVVLNDTMYVIGGRLEDASWATTGEVWATRGGKAWWNLTAGESAPVAPTPEDVPEKQPADLVMTFVGIGFALMSMGLGYGISKGKSVLTAFIFLNIGLMAAFIFELVPFSVVMAGFVALGIIILGRER